jgi:putative hydrolase of the HAD superfamily
MSGVATVCFDADDTLWHNLVHFDAAEKRFGELFANHMPAADATRALAEAEKRNIPLYGFGVKSFTLSMIETAIEVSGGTVEAAMIAKLMAMGRDMLDHDIELLPHVEVTLRALKQSHKLLIVTKGDLHHQERKVLASGLAHFFEGVEIVSDKKPDTYRQICKRHGTDISRTLMTGNSIRSDILPMIVAGGYGVYVPFGIVWDHEHEDVPAETPRFFEIEHLGALPSLLTTI